MRGQDGTGLREEKKMGKLGKCGNSEGKIWNYEGEIGNFDREWGDRTVQAFLEGEKWEKIGKIWEF